jgi:hypothetical protein
LSSVWADVCSALQHLTWLAPANGMTTSADLTESYYQGETWVLDSPEGVCGGQARFEYPATFVLFSKRELLNGLSQRA